MSSNISAKVIAHSIAPHGKEILTYELEMARYILAEFNTHRALSRNSASSRAIPVATLIKSIQESPVIPVHWGKNQAGMSADVEVDDATKALAESIWLEARDNAIRSAQQLAELGIHKQITNRLTECWVTQKVVATATDWDNFFHLRRHKDAQPEIQALAEVMWQAKQASTPKLLDYGHWHLPYVSDEDQSRYSIEDCLKLSASLCAQVSYRKSDDSIEKAIAIYDRLITSEPAHSSPMEHQGHPSVYEFTRSGNFTGWIQHRQEIKNNVCKSYKG